MLLPMPPWSLSRCHAPALCLPYCGGGAAHAPCPGATGTVATKYGTMNHSARIRAPMGRVWWGPAFPQATPKTMTTYSGWEMDAGGCRGWLWGPGAVCASCVPSAGAFSSPYCSPEPPHPTGQPGKTLQQKWWPTASPRWSCKYRRSGSQRSHFSQG